MALLGEEMDIDPNEEDEEYKDAMDRYLEDYGLEPFQVDPADPGLQDVFGMTDAEFDAYMNPDDLYEQFTDPAFLEGGIYGGAGATNYEDMTPEEREAYDRLFGGPAPGTVYGDVPSRGEYRGTSGIFTPGRGGSFRIGPNVSFPVGPFLAGGGAVTLTGDDDEETTVPVNLPGDDDMTDPETTETTPTYTLDPMGRIIPSSMAEADPEAGTPQGTLRDLQDFFNVYGGAGGMGGQFAQQMADVTGAGQTAYAQQVLGMTGDDINAFDIAQEASRQQRGALGDVFGLGPDATYADITAAGTAPMQGLSQVRETVLPGLRSAFEESEQRLRQGLSGRQLQNVEQQARARFGDRLRDSAAFVGEVTDVAAEEAGLFSKNLQDLLGISQTTSNLGQQEAYAMSPFTQAAIGSANLGPGLALAGDIGRQAAAGTPTPTDIFGLEAGERQFSLNQQALQQMAEAGRLDLISQGIGALASGFRGGPMAGLQQQPTYTTGTYTGMPIGQPFNPFDYNLGGF